YGPALKREDMPSLRGVEDGSRAHPFRVRDDVVVGHPVRLAARGAHADAAAVLDEAIEKLRDRWKALWDESIGCALLAEVRPLDGQPQEHVTARRECVVGKHQRRGDAIGVSVEVGHSEKVLVLLRGHGSLSPSVIETAIIS